MRWLRRDESVDKASAVIFFCTSARRYNVRLEIEAREGMNDDTTRPYNGRMKIVNVISRRALWR